MHERVHSIAADRTHPEENTLTLAPRRELFARAYRLDRDLPQIRQQIATMIATKNIMPRMQNASASLDVDRQSVPSDGPPRIRAEYSLTAERKSSLISLGENPAEPEVTCDVVSSVVSQAIYFDLRRRHCQRVEHLDPG